MSKFLIEESASARGLPTMKKGFSRRVYPLVSLNPYEGNWTIKVRVTNKAPMRTFNNARGQGNLFNVELTDEEGTQIQATMFKEAADKFYEKLQMGKLYFISKGALRAANKRFSSVNNDYEMTLNQYSEVEEIPEQEDSPSKIPLVKYNFIKMDDLGYYLNGRVVDFIGILHGVGSNTTIRRKSNNEEIPKRDITLADQSGKTISVSLWNSLATDIGPKLLEMVDSAPTVAIRSLRVSDFQGVSLSTTGKSTLVISPDIEEAHKLSKWYDEIGKNTTLVPAGASLPNGMNGAIRQGSAERCTIVDATKPEVCEGKTAWFTLRACITFIKPDQSMWYLACSSCNKKVNEEPGPRYWCEGCQKSYESCQRRYIMTVKAGDYSGEAWLHAFNEQAEHILGIPAETLAEVRSQEPGNAEYLNVLKKSSWVPRTFRISVAQTEYMNEKRQRITIRSVGPVDWSAECKLILEKISAMK